MSSDTATEAADAGVLREGLADRLGEQDRIRSGPVEAAFRVVPRHVFAPEASLEDAYADDVVITKRDPDGRATSSVSAPWLQAEMLERSEIRPGMRVLEIGSGGYNAALLAELVGPDGQVTTVDIDPDVTDRAIRFLPAAGYPQVNVVTADAEYGVREFAPYDRILVTVGSWDIPPAWFEQLTRGGILTVPLVLNGLSRSITFQGDGEKLVGRSILICGFVPMQGAGAPGPGRSIELREGIEIHPAKDMTLNSDRLRASLHEPRTELWTGVLHSGSASADGLDLWLNTRFPDMCVLSRTVEAGRDVVDPSYFPGTACLVDRDGGFAYQTLRRADSPGLDYEFGAYAHGPGSTALAEAMAGQIQAWDRDHRMRAVCPGIEVHPAGTPSERVPAGLVIDKPHTQMVLSCPS